MIDPKALENVLPALKRRAMGLTRNLDRADDLIQDTVQKMLENQDHFEEGTNFPAWATTVMYHLFCTEYRREQRLGPVRDLWRDETTATNVLKPRMEEQLDARAAVIGIFERVADPNRREVLSHTAVGAEYKEIAAEMGTPIGTVMSRLYRARRDARGQNL